MKVYFYHTQDLNLIQKRWKEGHFPGHFLYGTTHFQKYGVDVVMHKYKDISNKFQLMLYVALRVFCCREHFDAIYATSSCGLEFVIFLRALHLYRKPIIIWQSKPIIKADNGFHEMMEQILYRGIDQMLLFSDKLIETSLKSSKAKANRMQVCHWGADLESYDRMKKEYPVEEHEGFISTGKDKRDMPTLIRAFSATGQELSIYIAYNASGDNYLEILNDLRPSENIHINFIKGLIPNELAQKVWTSKCVTICCQETNYAVGLTTLIEALALGLPVIATRNSTYPFDIEKEGVGVIVPYYDSVAWEKAIRLIINNPKEAENMGKKARKLAEDIYNLDNCAREVSEIIKKYEAKPHPKIEKVQVKAKQETPKYDPFKTEIITAEKIVEPEKALFTEQPYVENHIEDNTNAKPTGNHNIINKKELYARINIIMQHLPSMEKIKSHLPEKEQIMEVAAKADLLLNKAMKWINQKINDLIK